MCMYSLSSVYNKTSMKNHFASRSVYSATLQNLLNIPLGMVEKKHNIEAVMFSLSEMLPWFTDLAQAIDEMNWDCFQLRAAQRLSEGIFIFFHKF